MEVGEKEFTEKKEAGEALLKECNKKMALIRRLDWENIMDSL